MKTLNFKSHKFAIGKLVKMAEDYICGPIYLAKGEIGKIVGAEIYDYPDLGLFSIRIVSFKFSNCDVAMGEKIADKCMEIL